MATARPPARTNTAFHGADVITAAPGCVEVRETLPPAVELLEVVLGDTVVNDATDTAACVIVTEAVDSCVMGTGLPLVQVV